ncbi:MAG: response regulator transcription factor, partial [Tepidimonas taiwanensis]|nr:response regulator transcription factor [Tepidimonas taiwanensis]
MIRVVLCDDHAVVRRGVRDTLMEATDIRVVGEADSYPMLREVLRREKPDVLLLDVDLPGRSGLEILAVLQEEGNPVRTVMVSMYPEDQYAVRAFRAGAAGYLNKASAPEKLVDAVSQVIAGRKYVTP